LAASGLQGSAEVSVLEAEAIGRRTLRKAAWRLIPLLSVCYMVAYMDRANVSFAALQMNRDLGFNAGVYGFGAGVFFISYAACELPSNFLLLKFGARRWIARIMLTWGLLAAAMLFVRTPASFYTLRFLLGMAEAGFFPGVIYYLSIWFPQEQRARAISRFYIAFPLSNVLMGLVAGSLLDLNGRLGLRGWQWLFLVEAAPAILLSGVVWLILPDGPATATWMRPEEREWLLARLREDADAVARSGGHPNHAHGITGFAGVLKDLRVVLIGLFFFLTLGSTYAFAFSAPAIYLAATGWTTNHVGLLIAGIAVVGAAAMLVVGLHSDRRQLKLPYVVVLSLLMAAGFAVSGVAHSAWVVVPALAVASITYYAMQGPALSLSTLFLDGSSAAVGIAAINMLSIVGGFVGPNWMAWSIKHSGGTRVGTGLLCVPCALAAGLILGVRRKARPAAKLGRIISS
jgi:ACS family tartrate transporter-like MFS transporter